MKHAHLSKIKALVVTGALTAALLATSASAAAPFAYTGVAGSSTTFQQALILDQDANVPTVDFEYTIAPGTANDYTAGSEMAVYAGNHGAVSGVPVIKDEDGNGTAAAPGKASYAPGHATVTSASGVTLAGTEKAALETMTVDFSGVRFAEPGIYRWVVTMDSTEKQGISYDTQRAQASAQPDNGVANKRILDVYVTDNGTGLVVSSYVFHEVASTIAAHANYGSGEVQTAGAEVTDKSVGFVNEYETYDISFSNAVTGNQASRDKYFKFVVAITNAGKLVDLGIDMSNAATSPSANAATDADYTTAIMTDANSADDNGNVDGQQWKTDAAGAVTKTVYLQHGQSIRINGLAVGANVTITETPEDYKCDKDNNQIVISNLAADSLEGNAFLNTRSGIIPTGVMMSVVPGAAILMISFFGLIVLKRKEREEELQEA